MMRNSLREQPLFIELKPLTENMGLQLVDVQESRQRSSLQVRIVIKAPDRITTIGDCSLVHKAVAPRLEMMSDRTPLHIEVSTPGLQRSLRDVYEFELFSGSYVRVYDDRAADWIHGKIIRCEHDSVVLMKQGEKEEEMLMIPFDHIAKAKLEEIWEERK